LDSNPQGARRRGRPKKLEKGLLWSKRKYAAELGARLEVGGRQSEGDASQTLYVLMERQDLLLLLLLLLLPSTKNIRSGTQFSLSFLM
jgi:hypothetical protein